MQLTSPAFTSGGPIPVRYACDGQDLSPPLFWSGAPPGTRSFVLLCDDPDAPAGVWHHWGLFDVPAKVHEIEEGMPSRERVGVVRPALNDFGRFGYGGPCPPRGHGLHPYHFRLLALEVGSLGLAGRVGCREVERAARSHVLATAELVGNPAAEMTPRPRAGSGTDHKPPGAATTTERGSLRPVPYDHNAELPKSVRDHLPDHAQTIYREVFNHAWQQYAGDPEHEEIAHRVAWSAVKRKYRKAGDRWLPKD